MWENPAGFIYKRNRWTNCNGEVWKKINFCIATMKLAVLGFFPVYNNHPHNVHFGILARNRLKNLSSVRQQAASSELFSESPKLTEFDGPFIFWEP